MVPVEVNMENFTFVLFGLLPLGLFSLFDSELRKRRAFAGFGFLAALAPVVASGLSKIFKGKSEQKKAKALAEQERQKALAEEASAKARFEAEQSSPAMLAQRQKFTLQLGKLLGKAGGKEKIPPSIYNYLAQQRMARPYVAGPGYVPPARTGGGIWDVLGGATEALSYLDTTKLKKPPVAAPTGFGTGFTPPTFQTGQVAQQQAPLIPLPTKRIPWGG